MTELQALLKYQEIDKKLFKLEKELTECPERKDFMRAKKFIQGAAEKLDLLEARAKQMKADASELTKKYLDVEKSLADFENLDELTKDGDVSFYKKKALDLSDTLKKIRTDLNALMTSINETGDEYQDLKKQVLKVQKSYNDLKDKYETVKNGQSNERAEIQAELDAVKKDISESTMEKYLTKRKEKVFPVAGVIKEKRCWFCGMEPPLKDIALLTNGGTIECENCHRILYAE